MAEAFAHTTGRGLDYRAVVSQPAGRLPCPVGCHVDNEVEESGRRTGRALRTGVWKDAFQFQMG